MTSQNGDEPVDQATEEQLLTEDELQGKLSHSELDERALDALKEYNSSDALEVLKEFCEPGLQHVGNKSAFLCNKMKNLKKNKATGGAAQGKGPDETKLQEILKRTGYELDVTSGQRKYGGPPPGWTQPQPGAGHEVFCGKIPKEIFEDELIPLFEECGEIWDLRLMIDPVTAFSRGYCFITFTTKDAASEAVKKFDGYEIRKGKKLKVNVSIANLRLFVGNIPKNKSKTEIFDEFSKRADGLTEVIVYGSADNPKLKNRGFAFLEYDTHKNASAAKRRLTTGRVRVWQCDIIVDWADPQEEPDETTMAKVKVLYVRNLTSDVTEDQLKEKFGAYGKVERVKKIKDYGFVHFEERDHALKAMEELQGQKIGNLEINVSLAKPPTENKKKEQRKREQEMRMMSREGYAGWDDYDYYHQPLRSPGPARGGMRRLPLPDPYYDDYYYNDDYYGGPYGPPPPFQHPMIRTRGRGGPYSPPPMRAGRGGGGPHLRGPSAHAGMGTRGVGARGRGPRPGAGSLRGGRGGPPFKVQPVQPRGGKRKAGGDFSQGLTKRRNTQDGNWGNQPIAQQPLDQSGYGSGGYDYSGNDPEWYEDSFGQNWG
ncbi:heterogeneous nuclear ribonucleoprotein Q-like isoform X1 [Babylonia areolata]|uniref:heterogeneous nuclear ribonucleoprotein Q-like isoform X1 n=1 Tax=Babylonia areolata TaxID=304850 RepID=UPI003FD4CF35